MASKRDLQVIVSAKDEASSRFKKMGKSMQDTLKKTAKASAVASAALTVGIKKSIDAYHGQERAEARLAQVTKQTVGATNDQIAALKEQASALQEVGVIGDEVTLFGQSQLATFALQTDAIQTLTPAMLDMAVATKGVNASQEDMINIGNMIGKVMQGQVGALSRVGVSFSEAQAEILKTGTEMEKAAALAEILDQNFGGLNETMAKTSEGQLAQLKNSFGDLMEQIGESVMPVIIMLVEEIKPVIEHIMQWVADNKELTAKLILLAAAILPILTVLPMLIAGIQALSTVLLFLAMNPIVLVIAAIAALVAGLVWLWNNSDLARDKIGAAWNKIKEVISVVVAAIKEKIAAFISAVLEKISGFFEGLKEKFQAGMDFIKGIWESAWGAISNFASGVLDKIAGFVDGIITRISNAIGKIKEFLGLSEEASGSARRVSNTRATTSRKSATGGNVFSGQTSLVGENGPELVTFGRTGTVTPTNRIGGGGTTVNVYVSGNTLLSENDELGEKIGDMIINQLRLQTRLS